MGIYFFASPTPFLALDQEIATRNHTKFENQEKCENFCADMTYEIENF
jgi:hypothetical protein